MFHTCDLQRAFSWDVYGNLLWPYVSHWHSGMTFPLKNATHSLGVRLFTPSTYNNYHHAGGNSPCHRIRRPLSSQLLPCAGRTHNQLHTIRHYYQKLIINYSTKQSPWKRNTLSARQEITLLLQNPKVHHDIHNSHQMEPAMGQIISGHTLKLHSFMVNFNIKPPLHHHLCLGLPRDLFHSGFPYPPRPTWLDQQHALHRTVHLQLTKILIIQFSPASCSFLSSTYKHFPLRSIRIYP